MTSVAETTTEVSKVSLSGRLKKNWASILQGESLKARVFRGGAWLGAGSFSEQVIRFGRNMILTRLLAPEAFGTMAVVLSACSVVQTIMDVGVREALIQNPKGSEDDYVGAAWWMAFGRGLSFWICVSAIAPFVAKFYGNPDLSPLFRVAALGLLFEGALSSRAYAAIREMKFRKWAIINHGGAIAGVVVTIVLSFLLRNVWALVLGYVAENVGRFTLSYMVCPYFPPRRLPLPAVRDLWKFSRQAFGLSLLNLIFARTDIFVLAKMFRPAEIGLYTMAIYLVQTPTSFVMNLLGQTLLPTFSRVQDDRARINRILIQVSSVLALVAMPGLFFLSFCGRSLLSIVYGSRYSEAAGPLMVASFVAVLNLLNGQITSVFFAKGHPQLHRRCVVIMAIAMIALIYPSIKAFGLVGGQLAALFAIGTGLLFQIARLRHMTQLDLSRYAKVILISGIVSAGIAVACLSTRSWAFISQPLPNIAIGIVGCIAAYLICGSVLFRGGFRLE